MQFESFFRMSQTIVRAQLRDVRKFRLIRPQEFLACGDVEKKIADRNCRARPQCGLFALKHLAAGDFNARAGPLFFGMRLKSQPRDRCDGWKRFAAKTKRGDCIEILDRREFAGCVALKGKHRIVAQHAAAVIDQPQQPPAAAFHFHAYVRGAGV